MCIDMALRHTVLCCCTCIADTFASMVARFCEELRRNPVSPGQVQLRLCWLLTPRH